MCPVLTSRPMLAAASSVSLRIIRAEVVILATDTREQQHGQQSAHTPFNQSMLLVTVDVCRVVNFDDVSTPRVRSRPESHISPSWSSLACGLVRLAVHVNSCPHVHSSFCPEPSLHFCCQCLHTQCCTPVVDSGCIWILLKHEPLSHGFSVSFDAGMIKRLREQVSAVVTAFDFLTLQFT